MKVLVTGAGGFVGPHVCAVLDEAGHDVVACSRSPARVKASAVEILDVQDAEACSRILGSHRPEAVIHLAAQASVARSWERSRETLRVNVIGSTNLLEAVASQAPDARVLLVGSGQEYGTRHLGRPFNELDELQPTTPYAVSKVMQEELGRLFWRSRDVHVVLARPFNHTGPGQSRDYAVGSFCWQVAEIEAGRAEPVLHVGDLEAARDFLDVRDVAAAYMLLLSRGEPGAAYNVASGRALPLREVLDEVLKGSPRGGDIRVESSGPRPGDPKSLAGDAGRLAALGWAPGVPMDRSIREMLEHCRRTTAGPDREG